MLFAWFAIGNFFLVFKILTTSLSNPEFLGTAGLVLGFLFEWVYLAVLITCFVLALGNRPQGSNKFYMTQVYVWAILMTYLLFASIYITVKSVMKQVEQGGFSFALLFRNELFRTLVVSMCSTWLLYLFSSILFLDCWHMLTCFLQYLLLTPTYVNVLNVYAFSNTHDITWGTKGDDKVEELPTVTLKPGGKVEVTIPTDDADLDAQYEAELHSFQTKWEAPNRNVSAQDKRDDYYKGFRSAVVLTWMFCNLALAAIVLNIGGVDHLSIGSSTDQDAPQKEKQRATMYLCVVLYSVAFLSGIKFMGSCWFLVSRLFRGV